MSTPRWRTVEACDHANENVCPFCDFDGYYARSYPGCPWAVPGGKENTE